jgi:hypothetical protein
MSTFARFFLINLSGVNCFHKSPDSNELTIDISLALSILLLWQLSYDVVIEQISAKVPYFMAGMMPFLIFAY